MNCISFIQPVYFPTWTKSIPSNIMPSFFANCWTGCSKKIVFAVQTVMFLSLLTFCCKGWISNWQIHAWYTKAAVHYMWQTIFFWSTDRINTLAISQLGLTRKSQLSRFKQFLLCRQFLSHQTLKYRRFSQQFNPYSWSSTMEYQQLFSVQYTISFIILHHHMFPLRRCQSPQFLPHSLTKPWRPKRLR